MKKTMIILTTILSVSLTATSAYARDLTENQKAQILEKCKIQAAALAHMVDENAKDHQTYEIFDEAKITGIKQGDTVKTSFKMHWDVESFDSSNYAVEMSATLGSPCTANNISYLTK